MRILGFDEAGRGSVLGPMAVGGYLLDAAESERIRDAGGRDSKGMTPARRSAAADALRDLAIEWRVVLIGADRIDQGNLNALEEDAFAAITAELRPDLVQIDAPVPGPRVPAYREQMAALLGLPLDRVEAANRAEDLYPAVGAASILAKVARDAAMADLRAEHGALGSGYPSDPATRAYLEGILRAGGTFPPFVRTRWETIQRLREEIEGGRQGDLFG